MGKKLYRSIKDKKIAGVCGGIAEYTGYDVSIIRLIAVLLLFCASSGFWAYIIMAIVVPEAPREFYQDESNKEDKRE